MFPGLGISVKRFNYDYDEKTKKYKPSYFMKKLKQITNVFVVVKLYVNINYYSKDNTDLIKTITLVYFTKITIICLIISFNLIKYF